MSMNPFTDTVLTVSDLNDQVKSLLEATFQRVRVEGEISNLTYHNSGHIYFSIKDENSTIRCVMFRGNASRLKFRLEQGQSIVIDGAISVYMPRGEYQINCFSVEPSGIGALSLAFKQLKEKLEKKGWFDHAHKKPLPKYPKHIVLVTSATGAALQDMKRVAEHRWKMVKITLLDTLVQGDGAVANIVANIQKADSMGADLIITGRGGGSIEDLWAFNEEKVAHAIYETQTPIVSAVGHEVDILISDFVADLRAPTPSAAMEMVLPDQTEVLMLLDNIMEEIARQQRRILQSKAEQLSHLNEHYGRHSIESRIDLFEKEIQGLMKQLEQQLAYLLQRKQVQIPEIMRLYEQKMQQLLFQKQQQVSALEESYALNDPSKRVSKGYVQLIKDGEPQVLENIHENDPIVLQDATYKLEAVAIKKSII